MEKRLPPRRRSDVLVEFLPDGSAVLYDPRTEVAYSLTASAAVVWDTCDGEQSADTMANHLAAVYEAPSDVIMRDVQTLLGHLSQIGLLDASRGTAL